MEMHTIPCQIIRGFSSVDPYYPLSILTPSLVSTLGALADGYFVPRVVVAGYSFHVVGSENENRRRTKMNFCHEDAEELGVQGLVIDW